MKIKIVSLVAVAFALLLTSGCANINSGNVGKGINPLPYKDGEKAIATTDKKFTYDAAGRVLSSHEEKTETGLEVNKGIQHGRLDMATDVGVAQAKGSSGGFWSGIFAPTYPTGYSGYGSTSANMYPNIGGPIYGPGLGGTVISY